MRSNRLSPSLLAEHALLHVRWSSVGPPPLDSFNEPFIPGRRTPVAVAVAPLIEGATKPFRKETSPDTGAARGLPHSHAPEDWF